MLELGPWHPGYPCGSTGGDPLYSFNSLLMDDLHSTDPDIFKAIGREAARQGSQLELIASENFVSRAVLEAMGSVMANKYAEGLPGRRYYGGCEFVDEAEELARSRAMRLFPADHANVQPHSGAQANMAGYFALLKPGDTYLDVPEEMRRYRSDTFRDKYLRLSFERLSRTITAHIAKDGYSYIHPREDRTLSIREAARIQTFPDSFRFAGHPTSRYRQIGNAVPPMLAAAVASSMGSALESGPTHGAIDESPTRHASPFRNDLIGWFKRNGREFPWRRTDLNPWQVMLVEMCLHRTRAEQVAHVADELLHHGRTPDSFLADVPRLEPSLATLGLRWRTDNLVSAARFVRDRLAGQVPDNWQQLVAIPGVGDYIASAVLCFAFNRPSVLMDTNTRRIARRVLGEVPRHPDWRLRLSLHELAGPEGADIQWNQSLLDLGALVCRARAPRCGECPVRAHCATGRVRG